MFHFPHTSYCKCQPLPSIESKKTQFPHVSLIYVWQLYYTSYGLWSTSLIKINALSNWQCHNNCLHFPLSDGEFSYVHCRIPESSVSCQEAGTTARVRWRQTGRTTGRQAGLIVYVHVCARQRDRRMTKKTFRDRERQRERDREREVLNERETQTVCVCARGKAKRRTC